MKTISCLALLGLAALSSAQVSFTAIIRDNKLSATEAAAAVILADALNLDASFVISTGRSFGLPIYDSGPAFFIADECNRQPKDVWSMRRQGLGWGVIAQRCGMHPSRFNQLRRQGAFDDNFWRYASHQSHGIRTTDYDRWRKGTGSSRETLVLIARNDGNRNRIESDWRKMSERGRSTSSLGSKGSSRAKTSSKSSSKGSSHGRGNSGSNNGKGKGRGGKGKP